MSVLSALAGRYTRLSADAVAHLHRLLAEWQMLADLSFADCLLLAPVVDQDAYVVLAQVRPYPAQTLYQEDLVGTILPLAARPKIGMALAERRIVREGDPEWRDGTPIREEAIPVVHDGAPIAAISAEQNLATARTPSHLELSYLRAAGDLAQMIAEGTFPYEGEEEGERELSPRVGDGFLQIGADGVVAYASPNAVSAYRRLGVNANIIGAHLRELGPSERHVFEMLSVHRPFEDEVESNGAWVTRRFMPVTHAGRYRGAIGLVRDITELRRRDRMLLIKDATIREIHHRVKNNLQTVASLLRLQARRTGSVEARAELEESVRRISSIALVHETLSQDSTETVEFDTVAQRILEMVEDSLVHPDRPIRFLMRGSAGDLASDIATPLSLIVSELVQNAVEHAFVHRGGTVTLDLAREDDGLHVVVRDDGEGFPEGFSPEKGNLGLQIVRTLATELRGELTMTSDDGARVELRIPIRR